MPNLEVFDVLTEALTNLALSQACVVEMDGDEHHVRCIYVRRQIREDVEGQVYVSAPVTISLALIDLPRRPQKNDRIVLSPDEAYKIEAGSEELGNGMIECRVTRIRD